MMRKAANKRKRVSSIPDGDADDAGLDATANRINKLNPFLRQQDKKNSTTQTTTTTILPLVLQFLELSSKKTKHDEEVNQEAEESSSELLADNSIQSIISFYQDQESLAPLDSSLSLSSILSKRDVAGLLLPWSMNRLLRYMKFTASTDTLADVITEEHPPSNAFTPHLIPYAELKALVFCLETLSASSTTMSLQNLDVSVASSLTQSNLHKVVPWTMRLSLSTTSHHPQDSSDRSSTSTTAITIIASKAYGLLVDHFYRPTLDVACTSLLPPLANTSCDLNVDPTESSRSIINSRHSSSVISAITASTLQLVSHLLDAGNPKKNFALLAAPTSMTALARIYQLVQATDVLLEPESNVQKQKQYRDNNNLALPLFRQILRKAWFHASQHMEGFRSLNRPIVPTTTLHSPRFTSREVDDDDNHLAADSSLAAIPTRNFHCYQENLLVTIDFLLHLRTSIADRDNNYQDRILVVQLLPLMLEVFVEQSKQYWQQQYSGSGSSSSRSHHHPKASHATTNHSATELAALQFRFWAHLMNPVLQVIVGSNDTVRDLDTVQSTLQLACLQSLTLGLHLVVEHQMYRPSHRDDDEEKDGRADNQKKRIQMRHQQQKQQQPKQAHRQCVAMLRQLTQILIDNREHDANVAVRLRLGREDYCSEVIKVLHLLLQLNHQLLHDRLGHVLALAAPWHRKKATNSFVSTIIQTYSRLRQLDHLVASFLSAANAVAVANLNSDESVSIYGNFVMHLLQNSQVATEFALSMEVCPMDQVRILCDMLNQSITGATAVSANTTTSMTQPDVIAVSVQMLVLLFRNARVDSYTASKVVELCHLVMNGAVASLLPAVTTFTNNGELSRLSPLSKQGLVLCGWSMDLQLRCAFWNDQDRTTVQPTDMFWSSSPSFKTAREMLDSATAEFHQMCKNGQEEHVSEARENSFLCDELHFLAGYRIQQLHSLIYESHMVTSCSEVVEPSTADNSSISLTEQARRLTGLFVGLAQRDRTTKSSKWTTVAQRVAHWTPYADIEQIHAFLTWLFTALSSMQSRQTSESQSHQDRVRHFKMIEERDVALSLLGDASFYELLPVGSELHSVGLSCLVDAIKLAVDELDSSSNTPLVVEGINLWKFSSIHTAELPPTVSFARLLRESRFLDRAFIIPELSGKFQYHLSCAHRLLDLARELPSIQQSSDVTNKYIFALLKVDVAVGIVLKNFPQGDEQMKLSFLKLASGLRRVLTRCYGNVAPAIGLVTDFQVLSGLIFGLIHSTKDCARNDSCLDLLRATGEVIRTILTHHCLKKNANGSHAPIQELAKEIVSSLHCKKIGLGSLSSIVLSRYVVSGLSKVYVMELFETESRWDVIDLIGKIKENLWPAITEIILSAESGLAQAECLLLLGEFVHALPLNNTGDFDAETLELTEQVAKRSLNDATTQRAALFLLSSFDPKRIRPDMKLRLIDQIITKPFHPPTPLQESAFLALIRNASESEIMSLLQRFLGRGSISELSNRSKMRFSQLLLTNVDFQSNKEVLAQAARDLFFSNIDVLFPATHEQESWAEDSVMAMSSLVDLCKSKEFVQLKERELALVLSKINSVLSRQHGHALGPQVPNQVFEACYKLLLLLLQRFSKQLYNCIPCVVSSLRAMLRQAMQGPPLGLERIDKGQKFGRLCETLIPHKEIYKKHVLGLLIDFIQELKGEMHPNSKKILLPAVFCLLDLLSQYETQQLNTMIDATGKTLFRSVFQDYQSSHVYKGQY